MLGTLNEYVKFVFILFNEAVVFVIINQNTGLTSHTYLNTL